MDDSMQVHRQVIHKHGTQMLSVTSSDIFQGHSQASLPAIVLLIQVGNMFCTDSSLTGSQVKQINFF